MTAAFVAASQAATSINVSVHIMVTIREIKTVVTNTVYGDAFIIAERLIPLTQGDL